MNPKNKYTSPAQTLRTQIVFLMLCIGSVYAQISVAPTILTIDSKTGIGNLFITNPSSAAQEVSVDFMFGYPGGDNEGNLVMVYDDTVAAKTYSLDGSVRAYPKAFVLEANKQQTIRIQARIKDNRKDLFAFTRIKITSSQKTADAGEKVTEGIGTTVNFKFDQIIPCFYWKGNVTTGIKVNDVQVKRDKEKLKFITDLERLGLAPFIGSMSAKLIDQSGKEAALREVTTAIYFSTKRNIEFDTKDVPNGKYRLVMKFETKRGDMAVSDILQAPPVTIERTVTVQ
jgi:hypothetical protein